MFEAATPQNNDDLNAKKGYSNDVWHRFALSSVYDAPAWHYDAFTTAVTRNFQGTVVFQAQPGYPMTISVFGDTANSARL